MSDIKFNIGDRVRKVTGYRYFGEVRSVFTTSRGDLRYVVENTGENLGMLFIFNEEQLEPTPDTSKGER